MNADGSFARSRKRKARGTLYAIACEIFGAMRRIGISGRRNGAGNGTSFGGRGYGDHPVKIIAAFAAGGLTDVISRIIAQQLSRKA